MRIWRSVGPSGAAMRFVAIAEIVVADFMNRHDAWAKLSV